MNNANKPKESKGRVAFKDVSNNRSFNAECSKHANAVKKRKMLASKYANNNKKGLAASSQSCESKKSGATVKKAPPQAMCKSSQGKLPQPKKPLAKDPSGRHYQDGPAHDIDKRDANLLLSVTEYVADMYEYYREQESRAVVDPLEAQQEVNERMRSILVDWMVEVHYKIKFEAETLYIAISLLDRYLSVATTTRSKLQLVGVTALLIATKYEEIYPADLDDLVFVCDKAYTRDEILDMEETMLKTLNYQLTIPTAYKFLMRFMLAGHADKDLCLLASYVLEESLISYDIIKKYKPSQLAAAAILIGRESIGRNAWSPTLLKYSEYREEDVLPVAKDMILAKSRLGSELRAVNKKYTSVRFGRIARKFDAALKEHSSKK